jgi:16S rRNA (guanine527-N7)-methyltransferase
MEDFGGKKVIDVGTGAGFPGLAMKIAQPEMELTLLDSLDKRINFLRDSCEKMGIEDVTCIHARAEEIPEGYRESFDFAVSRAVARLNLLCELCLPYVKKGGAFIAMKGQEMDTEIKEAYTAIKTMGAVVEKKIDYPIPGTDIVHKAVVLRKVSDTPKKYPRRWAQIKKSPL